MVAWSVHAPAPPWSDVASALVSALGVLAVIVGVIRIIGLRSLSKMSSFDFVVTLALGSILASVATGSTTWLIGASAIATLLAAQWIISQLRWRTALSAVVDNRPLLLMDGPRVIDAHLRKARVTEDDLMAKLRAANVTHLDQVLAVVLETTGDVNVLHGTGPIHPELLHGVEGAEHRS